MDFMRKHLEKQKEAQQVVIQKQQDEINAMLHEIEELQIENEQKERIRKSVEYLHEEMKLVLSEIDEQRKEYQKLIDELKQMRDVTNQIVFKGRWRWLRFFIK